MTLQTGYLVYRQAVSVARVKCGEKQGSAPKRKACLVQGTGAPDSGSSPERRFWGRQRVACFHRATRGGEQGRPVGRPVRSCLLVLRRRSILTSRPFTSGPRPAARRRAKRACAGPFKARHEPIGGLKNTLFHGKRRPKSPVNMRPSIPRFRGYPTVGAHRCRWGPTTSRPWIASWRCLKAIRRVLSRASLEGLGEGEPSLLFGVTTATPPWAEKVRSESTERRLIGSGIWPISREPMEDRPRAKALRKQETGIVNPQDALQRILGARVRFEVEFAPKFRAHEAHRHARASGWEGGRMVSVSTIRPMIACMMVACLVSVLSGCGGRIDGGPETAMLNDDRILPHAPLSPPSGSNPAAGGATVQSDQSGEHGTGPGSPVSAAMPTGTTTTPTAPQPERSTGRSGALSDTTAPEDSRGSRRPGVLRGGHFDRDASRQSAFGRASAQQPGGCRSARPLGASAEPQDYGRSCLVGAR